MAALVRMGGVPESVKVVNLAGEALGRDLAAGALGDHDADLARAAEGNHHQASRGRRSAFQGQEIEVLLERYIEGYAQRLQEGKTALFRGGETLWISL